MAANSNEAPSSLPASEEKTVPDPSRILDTIYSDKDSKGNDSQNSETQNIPAIGQQESTGDSDNTEHTLPPEKSGPLTGRSGSLGSRISRPGPTEVPGTRFGPYKLIKQVGEGGMGLVWMAEQVEGVKRHVALKLIKAGMDSGQMLARFEAERQALAMMDHPNIAKVLDAGTTESGRPYFVMELVNGIPMTTYCDNQKVPLRERLELFIQVCKGIQHAHQKGVIHRDIKPGNVLIASYDGKAVPKVIDFGLAKAQGQKLTERTMFTGFGAVLGTMEYMAPEQAEPTQMDIDTRADIYALGVMLYELLTGTTPLTRQRLKGASIIEVLRMIREEEAPKPSARLSQAKESLSSLAALRQIEPAKLGKHVRGELDWIVMKALDKDRERRYDSANAFALDVQRYLDDEPVLASPPSAAYRIRKFSKRNKGALLAAAVVLLALIGGIIGTSAGLVEAREQRDVADQERVAADKERNIALQERATADKERNIAQKERSIAVAQRDRATQAEEQQETVMTFFQNNVLLAVRPKDQQGGLGINATIKDAVDAAEPRISATFQDKPLAEAQIRDIIGQTYMAEGEANLAIEQYEQALNTRKANLGVKDTQTLNTMNYLANAYLAAGRSKDAVTLAEEALKLRKETQNPDDRETLDSMHSLATAYQAAGRLKDAVPLYESTLKLRTAKLGLDHDETLKSMNNLGLAYYYSSRSPEAVPILEEALKLRQSQSGPENPSTLTAMNNLGLVYQAVGRVKDALPLFEESLTSRQNVLGADHPETLASMNNLARAYVALKRVKDALPLLEESLKLHEAKLGVEHPQTLTVMINVARAYEAAGRLADAVPVFEETLKLRTAHLGADNAETLNTMISLAAAYTASKRLSDAEPLYRQLTELSKQQTGADSPHYANQLATLAVNLLDQHKDADAEPVLRTCLAIREKKLPDEWITFSTKALLGASLLNQKKYPDAEPLLIQGYEGMKQRVAKMPPPGLVRMNDTLQRIVQLYEATEQAEKTEEWRRKLAKSPKTRTR